LVGAIHVMVSYRNSQRALKTSFILIIVTFILILYGTFLVRSGVLGDSSVHSFTDLGLNGQLILYLMFFVGVSVVLLLIRWKHIPTSEREASTYSREFWVFIGAMVLCLAGFQVLVETSKPVYNKVINAFGGIGNMAPRADAVAFYSQIQLWFAVAVALLSGAGQYFWWKREDGTKLKDEMLTPVLVSVILCIFIIPISGITKLPYIVLLISGTYALVGNAFILTRLLKTSPKLSGGAVAHIGLAMMLIGMLFSSGYSKVVSLNNTGLLISRDQSEEFNNENLLLFINEPRYMAGYEIRYKGPRLELRGKSGYISKFDVEPTGLPDEVRAKTDLFWKDQKVAARGETVHVYGENTFYEIEYKSDEGKTFTLYPRAQVNESMGGLLASPDIKRRWGSDLYTHVSSIPIEKSEEEWSELEEVKVLTGKPFFVNDYVATLEKVERVNEVEGVNMEGVMAVMGTIKVQGEAGEYFPKVYFLIKGSTVAFIPEEVPELGVRFFLRNIHPETNEFTIGYNTTQKDWVVLKAMEKPLINVLWLGTFVLMGGFGMSLARRYGEFRKMRDKNQE
jgi:cytochrome c-type biogenesis protein CcmF